MKLSTAIGKIFSHYSSNQTIYIKNENVEDDGTLYIAENLEDAMKYAKNNPNLHIDENGQIGINDLFISVWCHQVDKTPSKETKDEAPF